jgi:hypothetical protein
MFHCLTHWFAPSNDRVSELGRYGVGLFEESSVFPDALDRLILQGDVTHGLTSPLKHAGRIFELCATREPEIYLPNKHVDVANTIVDESLGRSLQEDNLRRHDKDVLMARSHLFMDHGPKIDCQ